MIDPRTWVADLLPRLKHAFGVRLMYVGMQGSYPRGEATEESDIDLVVLLDSLSLEDLDTYRTIVLDMPEGNKACGFISGVHEFAHWPRHELFQFTMDTADCYGKLTNFIPQITAADIREGARFGASTLIHLLSHSYLYASADEKPAILKGAYKNAFFVMLSTTYLETGVYRRSKKELLASRNGLEKDILAASSDFPAWLSAHSEKEAFSMLLDWCRSVLIKL